MYSENEPQIVISNKPFTEYKQISTLSLLRFNKENSCSSLPSSCINTCSILGILNHIVHYSVRQSWTGKGIKVPFGKWKYSYLRCHSRICYCLVLQGHQKSCLCLRDSQVLMESERLECFCEQKLV